MQKITLILTTLAAACVFSACSPKYDWRDFHSKDAPFTVLFPGLPSMQTRMIDLDGVQVNMTMTASSVDGTTFAVGSAQLTDPAMTQTALIAMKTALLKNIGAKTEEMSNEANAAVRLKPAFEVEASGTQNGIPIQLTGHFIAQDTRIYQVIVMGKAKQVSREDIDMFLDSFRLN